MRPPRPPKPVPKVGYRSVKAWKSWDVARQYRYRHFTKHGVENVLVRQTQKDPFVWRLYITESEYNLHVDNDDFFDEWEKIE